MTSLEVGDLLGPPEGLDSLLRGQWKGPSSRWVDRKQWPIVARENLHYPFNSVIRKLGQDTQTVCVCNM